VFSATIIFIFLNPWVVTSNTGTTRGDLFLFSSAPHVSEIEKPLREIQISRQSMRVRVTSNYIISIFVCCQVVTSDTATTRGSFFGHFCPVSEIVPSEQSSQREIQISRQ
jgi:hypothetical protein